MDFPWVIAGSETGIDYLVGVVWVILVLGVDTTQHRIDRSAAGVGFHGPLLLLSFES